jgi:hypothetical protein
MSKHTPGPWEIDWYICREGNKELWRVPRSIGPAYVDHNHWAGNYITVDEANARLIAAAPDLLDALKEAATVLGLNGCFEAQNRARAAIAKATGAA